MANSGLLVRRPARDGERPSAWLRLRLRSELKHICLTIPTLHQSRLGNVEAQRGPGAGQLAAHSQQLFGPVAPHHLHVKDGQVVSKNKHKQIKNTNSSSMTDFVFIKCPIYKQQPLKPDDEPST